MPGLFFEFSILLASPELARRFVLGTQGDFVLGRYLSLFMGVFLAFVVGNSLMLLASLLQSVVGLIYRMCLFLSMQFQKYVLLPVLTRLTHTRTSSSASAAKPVSTPPRWLTMLYVRICTNVESLPEQDEKDAYQWWVTIAKQLLLKRYDLTEDKLPVVPFAPLQNVLTIPTPEEIRGSILVNASHATGWAALFASWVAPALCNKWYIILAFFLIGCGLLHDWGVARRLHDPALGNMLRLRAVLREFPTIKQSSPGQTDSIASQINEEEQ
jgi:hypothetical protein